MAEELRKEQHYAVSKDGVLTHIEKAHEVTEEFYCPHCGCHMIKRCGKVRTWHFAHDYRDTDDIQKECSYETYLHSYAKLRLKQWFEEAKEINLRYPKQYKCKFITNCFWRNHEIDDCVKIEEETINLKQSLDSCDIEKEVKINGEIFRPDLLWYSSKKDKNFIFIEIKVSHECTEKKKNSSARIIEFDVQSEEDIDDIINHDIQASDKVRYYGFKTDVVDSSGIIQPVYKLNKFILFQSGKAFTNMHCNCQNYITRRHKAAFELTIIDNDIDQPYFYTSGLAVARLYGIKTKNCCLCEYHKYDSSIEHSICTKKNTQLNNNSCALECEDFTLNENNFLQLYNDFMRISSNERVHIWISDQT